MDPSHYRSPRHSIIFLSFFFFIFLGYSIDFHFFLLFSKILNSRIHFSSTSVWKLRNLITSRRFIFSTFSTVFLKFFFFSSHREIQWLLYNSRVHLRLFALLDKFNPSLSLLEVSFPLLQTHLKRNTKENRNSYASVIRSDQRHWSIRRITADWDEMLSKRQFGAM